MEELQAAMDHNFGYPDETGKLATWFGQGCCAAGESSALKDLDERQIYEAVKRILSTKGSIDINELQKNLQGTSTTPTAPTAEVSGDMGRYQQIKRIMETRLGLGMMMTSSILLLAKRGRFMLAKYRNIRILAAASSKPVVTPYRQTFFLVKMLRLFRMADWLGPRLLMAYRRVQVVIPMARQPLLCRLLS